jgi:CheY-like chemotaxis protein
MKDGNLIGILFPFAEVTTIRFQKSSNGFGGKTIDLQGIRKNGGLLADKVDKAGRLLPRCCPTSGLTPGMPLDPENSSAQAGFEVLGTGCIPIGKRDIPPEKSTCQTSFFEEINYGMANRVHLILLAEDDPDDAELIGRALSPLKHTLKRVADGESAISHLAGHPTAGPTVVLLDLKMPRKNGFEVLQWIRASPAWADLPVIILTSSDDPGDKARANNLGATAYLIKKFPFRNLLKVLDSV